MPDEVLAVLREAETTLAGSPRPHPRRGSLRQWAQVVAAAQRVVNAAAAVQDEAIVAVAAIEPEVLDDGTVVECHRSPGHVALDAPAVVSVALSASAVHAEHRVRAAVRRAADGPAGTPTHTGLGGLHEAMRAGRLDPYRAGVVADELELAPPPVAAAVLVALGGHLTCHTAAQLRRRCRTVLSRVSPDLLRQRATRARQQCALRRWADEPGVDKWEGTFPSEDAARGWAAIDAHAQRLLAEGTCQHIDTARSKALIDLVTGSATITTLVTLTVPATPDDNPPVADQPPAYPSPVPEAAGPAAEEMASVAGHLTATTGSPQDLVQVCIGNRGEKALVPRAYLDDVMTSAGATMTRRACHPDTGALLDHSSTGAYRAPPHLAALVRRRDGHCRFPGCHVSARFCDLDHVRPWPNGPTRAANLISLCRRHHRIKQRPTWRLHLHPDATTTWTDPTGATTTTQPVDALSALVLPASAHAIEAPCATGSAGERAAPEGHTSDGSGTDRHSALQLVLEHAQAGLTQAEHIRRATLRHTARPDGRGPLRVDLHHQQHSRTAGFVLAQHWPNDPGHRTSHRASGGHDGGGGPPF